MPSKPPPSPGSKPARPAPVPPERVRLLDPRPPDPKGRYVLYWMVASRRLDHNFALDRALELCRELDRPLLIFEPLRAGYRWASARHHAFVLAGMADQAQALEGSGIGYLPYVEPAPGDGAGLLAALCAQAAALVSDDFPCFFLPHLAAAGARAAGRRFELVDSNGLLPLSASEREFPSAHTFRRFLHKSLAPHLLRLPTAAPLASPPPPAFEALPRGLERRWPSGFKPLPGGAAANRAAIDAAVKALPIDQTVAPWEGLPGGSAAAARRLEHFLAKGLPNYEERNQPDQDVGSGLSPYLHFGQISAAGILRAVAKVHRWTPAQLTRPPSGSREGWWGLPSAVEGFLDELITWRELGFNACRTNPAYDRFESLPAFARTTLAKHARDPRPWLYSHEQLEKAQTHDALWNAAQTQLVREGRMHNYLRMLWGKKVLEWSARPEDAFASLVELNNKYALDGRDPNSYTGITWVFGRYDRAWGPERPIFGTVRYMSSDNTARKLSVKGYLARYGGARAGQQAGLF